MTPRELRAMSSLEQFSVSRDMTAHGPHDTLPWLVIVDHKPTVKEGWMRRTMLIWAKDEIAALKCAGSQAKGGRIKGLHVVDPSQNLNCTPIALNFVTPLSEPSEHALALLKENEQLRQKLEGESKELISKDGHVSLDPARTFCLVCGYDFIGLRRATDMEIAGSKSDIAEREKAMQKFYDNDKPSGG